LASRNDPAAKPAPVGGDSPTVIGELELRRREAESALGVRSSGAGAAAESETFPRAGRMTTINTDEPSG